MRNSGMDELQTGIKIGRRNINNLRYVCESESEVAQSCPTLSDPMDAPLQSHSEEGQDGPALQCLCVSKEQAILVPAPQG